mgnify:CR=1 FL=1|tara:strand:- start:6587 stop:8500 length:1914 start_codon:yes stop_codon:yes gene_type:complete
MNTNTTSPPPKVYTATVDDRFLSKVDRVFDASPRTVCNELLQNARRAGASRVCVTLDDQDGGTLVTFVDNGRGIPSPEPLLRLAGKGWSDETEETEDPAGMGFFCLSNFALVRVGSRDWTGEFTPAVFRGEVGMVPTAREHDALTLIQWHWPDQARHNIYSALSKAAAYCGLEAVEISYAGTHEVLEPKSYLQETTHTEMFEDKGYGIGIADDGPRYSGSIPVTINFHGVQITEAIPYSCFSRGGLSVRVDVFGVGGLQLVLPARNALKHTVGRDELLRLCERKLFEWVAAEEKGAHTLAYSYYKRARDEFGIDIGEAKNTLSPWGHGGPAIRDLPCVIVDLETESDFLKELWYDAQISGTSLLRGVKPSTDMVGYQWYDALPHLGSVDIHINDQVWDSAEVFGWNFEGVEPSDGEEGLFVWVDKLEVHFLLGGDAKFHMEPEVLVTGEEKNVCVEDLVDTQICVVRRAEGNGDLAALITDNAENFLFPDGLGEDEAYNALETFRRCIYSDVLTFLGGEMVGALFDLTEHMRSAPTHRGSVWSVSFDGRDTPRTCPAVTSFSTCEEADANHKTISLTDRQEAHTIPVSSKSEVTHARVEAYLEAELDYRQGFLLSTHGPTLDLDAWEAAQNAKGGAK